MQAWRSACKVQSSASGVIKTFRSFSTTLQRRQNHSIAALLESAVPEGSTIQVNGFVQSVRKLKKVAFAAIRDGSSLQPLQAVLSPEQAQSLSNGTAVSLSGLWQKCADRAQQTHELRVAPDGARMLGENDPNSDPIQKKFQSAQFLRTVPHLRARIPHNALLLRLRSHVIATLTGFFADQGFVQTHTPIITSSDCEGAGEVFTISSNASKVSDQQVPSGETPLVEHFFRNQKYLTVSAQLHLEALTQSVGKVWTLSPTFRAEKSDTPRHLSEFYMLEAEMSFVEDVGLVMDVVESMLRAIAARLQDSSIARELCQSAESRVSTVGNCEGASDDASVSPDELSQRWAGLRKSNWPRVTYADAITQLEQASASATERFERKPRYEDGLQAEHERYLAKYFGQGSPVFITHYPRNQKPFYMTPSGSQDRETVECFDLLVPDLCELVGGSMREHRSKELMDAMRKQGMLTDSDASDNANGPDSATNLQWYIDLRRYGSVPHGGFGLGFDRLIGYLAGVSNIRDVVAFPRWHGRCDA